MSQVAMAGGLPSEAMALLSVFGVSGVSLICLLFLAVSPGVLDKILICLVAYSIGGLLGEVVFHMIPDIAGRPGGFSPQVAWVLIGGFLFSYLFEKTLHVHGDEPKSPGIEASQCRISCVSCGESCGAEERKEYHPKAPCMKHPDCPPSPAIVIGRAPESPRGTGPLLLPGAPPAGATSYGTLNGAGGGGGGHRAPQPGTPRAGHGHGHGHGHKHAASWKWTAISPTAFIILLASTLHNVIDGVIIAGAFLTSASLGLSTTIAVVCHEIPHEIGDFAVLVHAGLTKRRAFLLNLFSAAFSIAGCSLYLLLQSHLEAVTPLLVPFAGGTFLYVAAVDLVPHLLKSEERGASVLHFLFLISGLLTMSELTKLEALLIGS